MIISEKYKFVFISMPKTGTHSFFYLLQNYFYGTRQGPNYHEINIPDDIDIDRYTVFTTVRNPYERLVAIWNSLLHLGKEDKLGYREIWLSKLRNDDSFLNFVRFAAKKKDNAEYIQDVRAPMILVPQYRRFSNMPSKTVPIHIEHATEEFHQLPFVDKTVEIPEANEIALARPHPLWDEVKTDEITYYANEWAGEDFELFGYNKEE